nr:nucleotidyl transferase AbiEii/AbiGii toxin family protein [Nitrospinota bacterium]
TILSQKIHTIFERKRTKGRDYFDVVFLFSKANPDYKYLAEKLQISTQEELKVRLTDHIRELNFEKMAEDVSHFLTGQDQNDRVLLFKTFVESL